MVAKFFFVVWALFVSVVAGVVGTFLFIQMPCSWFGQTVGNGCGYEWLGKGLIAGAITAIVVLVAYLTWYFRRQSAQSWD